MLPKAGPIWSPGSPASPHHEVRCIELLACSAGEVKGFNVEDYIPAKEARHMDTFIHYGIAAGIQALRTAASKSPKPMRGAHRRACRFGHRRSADDRRHARPDCSTAAARVSPFFVPASIINMISGHLSIMFGLKGPNLAVVTACTTGLHCIGQRRADRVRRRDVMVAGGAESTVSPLGIGGFAAARALSTRNDDPATASPPVGQGPRRLRAGRRRRRDGARRVRAREGAARRSTRKSAASA
jgi:3-oxoacyl-[acyl-carrier-protein] synthase II